MEPNLLVDLNADGTLCNIPYPSCATMVKFMWHTLVDGAVHLDVDIISNFVRPQIGSQSNITLLPERPGEEVSGTGSKSMAGRHLQSRMKLSLTLSHKVEETLGFGIYIVSKLGFLVLFPSMGRIKLGRLVATGSKYKKGPIFLSSFYSEIHRSVHL